MLRIGIVGLPQTGKTTLFQILTRAHGSGIGSGRQEARVGVVRVPDPRLDRLIEMFKPQKNVYATIEYIDMPGSVIELARTGVQSQALRELDALVHVVRAFEDDSVPMEEDTVDPKRDIENVELELILSDLAVVEKRLERLDKDIKKQKNPALEKEFQVLKVCKVALDKQTPLREVDLGGEDSKVIRGYTFLSLKPMLYVLNLGEGDAAKANLADQFAAQAGLKQRLRTGVSAICGKVEAELAEMSDADAAERRLKIRANADIPRDAKQAMLFGAEGIGLCRTEHMFFAEDRIEHMRTMILADNEKDRRAALKKLLPMQRADFVGLFKAMGSLPVTIRTIDPPLHEFLPKREDLLVQIATLQATKPRSPKLKELRTLLARVEELHEQNPMLGLRGCRLGIKFPEITEMQVRAIIEAAVAVKVKGGDPHPEIMIPLVGSIEEMRNQSAIVRSIAEEIFKEKGAKVEYMVGTMIELPRAALTADQIAEEAEFFSFGTNDLTQTTYGISRDDINSFLPAYLKAGIFKQDPFATLDQAGVGQLVKWRRSQGTQHARQPQGGHLRRAWRRSREP